MITLEEQTLAVRGKDVSRRIGDPAEKSLVKAQRRVGQTAILDVANFRGGQLWPLIDCFSSFTCGKPERLPSLTSPSNL